jgi:hypothetical protein
MSYPSLPATFSSLSEIEKNRAIDKVLSSTLALSQKTFGIYHCFFDTYSVYRQSSYPNARHHFLLSRSKSEKKSKSSPTTKATDKSKLTPTTKYVPPHKRTETKPTSNDASAAAPVLKPQAKPVRPRAHQPTPVNSGKQSRLTTDLLSKIDSSLRRHANDKEVIPTAITSMFESASPDAPVFDRLFPGFPRQRLSDQVIRHSGKFTSISKELFHQLLSDLASRLTKRLKLKLTPAHMSLLMKKLSAAINYKLRKSSKANAKKDAASKLAKDSDPVPAPPSKPSKAKKSQPRQKKEKTSTSVVFIPSTEEQVRSLTTVKTMPDTDPNSEVYISKLTQVRAHLKLLQALEFALSHPISGYDITLTLDFCAPPELPIPEYSCSHSSDKSHTCKPCTAIFESNKALALDIIAQNVRDYHTPRVLGTTIPRSLIDFLTTSDPEKFVQFLSLPNQNSRFLCITPIPHDQVSPLTSTINDLLMQELLLRPF